MLLVPALPVLLLATFTRRNLLLGLSTFQIAHDVVQSPSYTANDSTSSELYLARPLGMKDGDQSISIPSASIEYLLPAARVGVYIYKTLAVAESLAQLNNKNDVESTKNLEVLESLLLHPPSFIKPTDPTVTRGDPYSLPPLVGELAVAQQKQKERQLNSIEVGLAPQFFEVGELIGERRAWDRLSKSERKREEASEVRRAFNIYTTNINFNTKKYAFSGSKEEKSKLIREDKLPTAGDVIRSDLDARDLYRNAVQTGLDDARAEYLYQKRQEEFDVQELVGLLSDAKRAVDSWFGFIPDQDVRTALEMVKNECSS
jgi:hypothetical protein